MKKHRRKVNEIKALKYELAYYKRQRVPVKTVYQTQLKHLRISSAFRPYELQTISEDRLPDILLHRMASVFKDNIKYLPIETSFDVERDVFMVELDLWVKENQDESCKR